MFQYTTTTVNKFIEKAKYFFKAHVCRFLDSKTTNSTGFWTLAPQTFVQNFFFSMIVTLPISRGCMGYSPGYPLKA